MKKVSVLIVSYNEEENISQLLMALNEQTAKTQIVECLIADNGSVDKTIACIKNQIAELSFPTQVFERNVNNIGEARQQLVEAASSEWIVFIDADCNPQTDWLEQLLRLGEKLSPEQHAAGFGGGQKLSSSTPFGFAVNQLLQDTFFHFGSAQGKSQSIEHGQLRLVDHLPTTNALFWRPAIKSIGGFSPEYHRAGEDLDLGLKLRASGHSLYLSREPTLINNCADGVIAWMKRMFRFGTAQGLVAGRRNGPIALLLLGIAAAPFLLFALINVTSELHPFVVLQKTFVSMIGMHVFVSLVFSLYSSIPSGHHSWLRVLLNCLGVTLVTAPAYAAGALLGFLIRCQRFFTDIFSHSHVRPSN